MRGGRKAQEERDLYKHIYTHKYKTMPDSNCCMAETQHCKEIILQLKKIF